MPADTETKAAPDDFPTSEFPAVFADGVISLVNSPAVVKFFLGRFEPSFSGDGRTQLNPITQIIMPIDGFANMFVFFEAQLRVLVQTGYITEARLTELRNILTRNNPT
jgi:hypothetical protein